MKHEEYLKNIALTAIDAGIIAVVITDEKVLGLSEDRSAFIFHDRTKETDKIEFLFNKVGVIRLEQFVQRLNMISSDKDFNMEFVIDEDDKKEKYSKMVRFSSDKYPSAEFRFANPATISKPKPLSTEVYGVSIKSSDELVREMGKISSAWSNRGKDLITLGVHEEVAFLSKKDNNNDKVVYEFDGSPKVLIDEQELEDFSYDYSTKNLLALLKVAPDTTMEISKRGLLRMLVRGLTVHLAPIM